MPARNARHIMYQIQTIMGPKLSKMFAKAFSGGHNHGTQHSACVSSHNQKAGKIDLAMYDAISYCFSCAGAHQETLSYLWSSSCFRRLAGSTGIGAPDARASCLASTRCSSSFRDRPCRSTSSSLCLANQGISSLEFQAKNAHVDQWPLHCIKTNKACHI